MWNVANEVIGLVVFLTGAWVLLNRKWILSSKAIVMLPDAVMLPDGVTLINSR